MKPKQLKAENKDPFLDPNFNILEAIRKAVQDIWNSSTKPPYTYCDRCLGPIEFHVGKIISECNCYPFYTKE